MPTPEDNEAYNALLSSIEGFDSDNISSTIDDIRSALKMLWAATGGEVEETRREKANRERAERRRADSENVINHVAALRAMPLAIGSIPGAELSVRAAASRASAARGHAEIYQTSTGIIVAAWWPLDSNTTMGGKRGPSCKTAADVAAWLKSV